MIIVEIQGGLGNQMFIYALGRRMALERNVPLYLDLTWFNTQDTRQYRLSYLNIQENIAPIDLVEQFRNQHILTRVQRRLSKLRGKDQHIRMLREKLNMWYQCDDEILNAYGHLYLRGYFQNIGYFKSISDLIQSEFRVKTLMDDRNAQVAQLIQSTNSVCLHIRRGDYVTQEDTRNFHGVLTLSYYHKAIQLIADQHSDLHVFIFSDDVHWARNNLKLSFPTTLMDFNGVEKDYEDLRLMSLCRHHIIANSSFSWWGAWLARENGIVIAPAQWVANQNFDTKGLLLDHWHVMHSDE